MGDMSEHFSRSELACRCGCNQLIDENVPLDLLEFLRKYFDKPIIVHCCMRCEPHNKRVGGVDKSHHTTSSAVDFHVKGLSIKELHRDMKTIYAEKVYPNMGLGIYDWGVHVDLKGRRTWS